MWTLATTAAIIAPHCWSEVKADLAAGPVAIQVIPLADRLRQENCAEGSKTLPYTIHTHTPKPDWLAGERRWSKGRAARERPKRYTVDGGRRATAAVPGYRGNCASFPTRVFTVSSRTDKETPPHTPRGGRKMSAASAANGAHSLGPWRHGQYGGENCEAGTANNHQIHHSSSLHFCSPSAREMQKLHTRMLDLFSFFFLLLFRRATARKWRLGRVDGWPATAAGQGAATRSGNGAHGVWQLPATQRTENYPTES